MSKRCLGCMDSFRDDLMVCPRCGYIVGTPADEKIHMDPGNLLHNRYIVGKVLGYGSFGVTYIGWDGKLQQKVAIKEYLPGDLSTRSAGECSIRVFSGDANNQFHTGMKKFIEEARHLAKFQSEPGIVRVFDSFEENNTAYIIMEYLDGETLAQYLAREGKMPEDEAVELLRPVMKSLEVVHAEGMIHRDIAPDNIFLTENGAKLIDFGASRYASITHSHSLTVIVKSGYSPEEQYRSRGDQGPHSDVYALAATLYKMVTGVTPPDAMERRTKYETKNKETLVPPHKYQKKISVNREIAILNAMNVRIEDRTPDIGTFMKELDADPPAKRIFGKIKKLNFYIMPLWVKITVPTVLACLMIFSGLMLTGVIDFSNFSEELIIPQGIRIVPDVEGYQQDEAVKIIEREHLQVRTAGTVQSEYIPAGKIVLQDPMGGSYLKQNGAVYLTVSSGKEVVYGTMPHLIWGSLEEAREKLKTAGMGEPIVTEVFDDHVTAGNIISQSIAAGEQVEEGTVVELTVSKGAAAFQLADVRDMALEDAQELLISQGLLVSVEYEKNDEVPENCVISQNVPAGSAVKRGDEIVLKVSSGRETIEVADVTGKPLEEAEKVLKKQGFKVKTLENFDDYVPAGCIISQDPGAGTNQMPGAEILLYVSKGAKPKGTAVADVIGMSSENATRTLEEQGFSVEVYLEYNDSVPSGTVYAQSPDAGVSKMPGATITIYVSLGEEINTIAVPNVTGMYWEKARSVLEDQDFQVEIYWDYNNTVPENEVYDQSPAAGTAKLPGAVIEIYVSKGGQPVSVSFDGNGGSVDVANAMVRMGQPYGQLPTAYRTGYTFMGWYLSEDGSVQVTESTIVDIPYGHTLYALWQVHSHTLTFDTNGGDTGSSSVTLTYGSPYGTLPTPSRQHYTFDGWYTSPDGGSKVSTSTTMGDEDATIYAHWSLVPYTVSWEDGSNCTITVERTDSPRAGAGTGKLSNGSKIYYGDVLKVIYEASDGYTVTDYGSESITVSGNVGGDQIYAKSSLTPYTVSWEENSGCIITVQRTDSPRAGAGTGKLSNGSKIYYGDVLRVTYEAASGYTLADHGSESITVSGNVGSSQIYGSVQSANVTYQILYQSINGTDLGSDEITKPYGSSQTISAPERDGYHTPDPQTVNWDSSSSKTIVFQYTPVAVSNPGVSGQISEYYSMEKIPPTVSYSAEFEFRNRTQDSIEVRVTVTETIKFSYWSQWSRWLQISSGGKALTDFAVVGYDVWTEPKNYDRSATAVSAWFRVPVNTTNATSVTLDALFYDRNDHNEPVTGRYAQFEKNWNINVPAY